MYVCNVEEGAVVDGNAHVERVKAMAASRRGEHPDYWSRLLKPTLLNLKMQKSDLCS